MSQNALGLYVTMHAETHGTQGHIGPKKTFTLSSLQMFKSTLANANTMLIIPVVSYK